MTTISIISIFNTVKTPSNAIQFMLDGLRTQSKRKDFKIDMNSYGAFDIIKPATRNERKKIICYGCAATCAIQQIAQKNLIPGMIGDYDTRAQWLGFDEDELKQFEWALDSFRMGAFTKILNFFGIYADETKQFFTDKYSNYFLTSGTDWENYIGETENIIADLKERGL